MNAATKFLQPGVGRRRCPWAGKLRPALPPRRPGNTGRSEGHHHRRDQVILTPTEIDHARRYARTELFILSNIALRDADDGTLEAVAGEGHIFDPWHIEEGTPTPIGFPY